MGIKITWDLNTEPDIDKYKVYIQDVDTGQFETPIEIDHPTHEYTDDDGDSSKRYFVSALDTSSNESPLSSPVRITENNTCYVTGYFVNQDGSVAAGIAVSAKIDKLPYIYDSQFWKGLVLEQTTNASGLVAFTLPREATVIFTCAAFGLNARKEIPDEANKDLSELLGS